MKLWVDDIRPAPDGYVWCKSVNEAKMYIVHSDRMNRNDAKCQRIELIDMDHDAGDYVCDGGDYIRLLDWLEKIGFIDSIPIHIHSMNPVGVQNMRAIIQRNGWEEV